MLLARKGYTRQYDAETNSYMFVPIEDTEIERPLHYHFSDETPLTSEYINRIDNETDFSDYGNAADDWNEREFTNAVVFDPETGSAIDLDKTPRYHAHLLNVFRTKDGTMRCGSIAITRPTADSVKALCVKCKVASTINVTEASYGDVDYDREWMITWTRWIIQHGHNHAAQWARKYIIG